LTRIQFTATGFHLFRRQPVQRNHQIEQVCHYVPGHLLPPLKSELHRAISCAYWASPKASSIIFSSFGSSLDDQSPGNER
jgi:hypothetical protein